MPNPLFAASSLMLLLAAPAAMPAAPEWDSAVAGLQQQQRVTIHVPRVTFSSTTIIMRSAPRPPAFVEKKAKDCVKVEQIAGFAGVTATDGVDLVLRDGSLLRAKLGRDCPAIGFYGGFYVKANEDRQICAGRDAFRTRSGRSCGVERFRKLVMDR